jgi:hypothetical protein
MPHEHKVRSAAETLVGRHDIRYVEQEFTEFAKREGFAEIEIHYTRLGKADGGSSANGGRQFNYWIDLATGKRTNLTAP